MEKSVALFYCKNILKKFEKVCKNLLTKTKECVIIRHTQKTERNEVKEMAFKCLACGHIFEDGEQARWSESRGEYWGVSCSEEMTGCPICKGDYERTTPCEICGSEHLDDELSGGVCGECIDEYRKDFNCCYEISLGETTEIKINSLLASLFDVGDIEQILKEYIRDKCPDVDCSQFIDEDKSWFGERIAEEVRKNENSKKES